MPPQEPQAPARLSERWQELFWALPPGEMRHKLRSLEIDVGRALRGAPSFSAQKLDQIQPPQEPQAPTRLRLCPACTRPVRDGVQYCPWCKRHIGTLIEPQPPQEPAR